MNRFYILIGLMVLAASCVSQRQGVSGKVIWVSGNQMPGPEKNKTPQTGIAREIYIYKVTNIKEAKSVNGFFTIIETPLIAKVTSSVDGSFRVKLPAGEYSIFTKEPDGLFANIFDGKGRINVVEVKKNTFTNTVIQINYGAAY